MRVLICGDREWPKDDPTIGVLLSGLLGYAQSIWEDLYVIEGCARGADWQAHEWFNGAHDGIHAIHDHVFHEHFPADWKGLGKRAGPLRNQAMLDIGRPELVFAFHDNLEQSKGTADMVNRAKAAGKPTYVIARQYE